MGVFLNGQKSLDSVRYSRLIAVDGPVAYIEVPRLTETQRDALDVKPGTLIYNTDLDSAQIYSDDVWGDVGGGGIPTGVSGDVLYHNGAAWGTANTGPLTTPTRTLILLGSSMMFPDASGAEYYEDALAGGRIVRGAVFEASASDISAQIGHPMPFNWDGGDVFAEFVFVTPATSGTVTFSIAGRASTHGRSLDDVFGSATAVTLNVGAQGEPLAWDLWTTAQTDEITIAGSPDEIGRRWVQWQIVRDKGDTCAEDVILLAVIIHYQTEEYSDA